MKKSLMIIALFILGVVLSPTASAQNNRHGRRPKSLDGAGQAAAAQQKAVVTADARGESEAAIHSGAKFLRFDVSENAKRFIFDETPLDEDGLPAYANEFITEGYIYPYGTLTVNEDGKVSGVNEDGSPEFPEKVIGRWTCRGWHTGEGAKTVTGPWVITHQLYDFDEKPGKVTLTTDGVELVDIGVPVERAIIGGTGPYLKARGEAVQTMLGFNQLGGVGLRFVVKVTK